MFRKNTLLSVIMLLFVSAGMFSVARAANTDTVKSHYTSVVGGGMLIKCSPDGDWGVMGLTPAYDPPCIYQKSTNTLYRFPVANQDPYDIAPEHNFGVGHFPDTSTIIIGEGGAAAPLVTAGYFTVDTKDWYPLPFPDDYILRDYSSGSNAIAISEDGRRIVGMMYRSNTKDFRICTWYDKKFERIYEDIPFKRAYGAYPTCISGDGKTIGGWTNIDSLVYTYDESGSKTDSNLVYVNRTPILLDVATGKYTLIYEHSTSIKDIKEAHGEVHNINYDGSKCVGSLPLIGAFLYEKDKGVTIVAQGAGSEIGGAAISDDGTVVGQINNSAFIYKEGIGTEDLQRYATNTYGVKNCPPFSYAVDISRDGKTIWAMGPGVLYLSGEILPNMPQNVTVSPNNDYSVTIKWDEPVKNGWPIKGYHVYRDSVKISELLVTKRSYTDSSPSVGIHCYTVTTEYNNTKVSEQSVPACLQTIDDNTAYSPKKINANVVNNTLINVNWGFPNPFVDNISVPVEKFDKKTLKLYPTADLLKAPENKAYYNSPDTMKILDPAGTFRLKNPYETAISSLGDYIYTCRWFEFPILSKYDSKGVLVEDKASPVGVLDEMTSDGTHLYGVKKDSILKFDPVNGSVVEKIKFGKKVSHITYIPQLDNNKGGFEIGDYDYSMFIDKAGKKIKDLPLYPSAISGTATYKDALLILEQVGSTTNKLANLTAYNINTMDIIDSLCLEIPRLSIFNNYQFVVSGGLTIAKNYDGATCLMAVIQNEYGNMVLEMELEKPEGLLGYNIYRNGNKINSEPYPYRNYQEIHTSAGVFEYQVSSVFESKNESIKSPVASASITDKGTCTGVTNLKTTSSYNQINLSWNEPAFSGASLFGYYILRDGKLVKDAFLDKQFTEIVAEEGDYKYEVISLYTSGCESSVEKIVNVNNNGKALPVSNLSGTNKASGVELKWDAPHFDTPLGLRYGDGIPNNAIGHPTGGSFIAVIGWAENHLTKYKDFLLTDVDFYIEDKPSIIDLLVIEAKDKDLNIIVDQSISRAEVKNKSYNKVALNTPVKIDPTKEYLVGFRITNDSSKFVLGIDRGPAVNAFGNLITDNDGATWQVIAEGNWCINPNISKLRKIGENEGNSNLVLKGYKISKDNNIVSELTSTTSFTDSDVKNDNDYTYTVSTVWDGSEDIPTEITISVTNIEDALKAGFSFYPNPVSDILNVNSTSNMEKAWLYNAAGICVKSYNLNGNEAHLDFKNISEGVYILKIQNNKGLSSVKLIKK